VVLKQSKCQTSEQEVVKRALAKEIEETWNFTAATAKGTCHRQQSGLVAPPWLIADFNSAKMKIAAVSGRDWAAFAGLDGLPRPFSFA
jgi:hypothetical protein